MRVVPEQGVPFSAHLSALDAHRLELQNVEQTLSPDERVIVDVLGHAIVGRVADTSSTNVSVTLHPSTAIFTAIEAFEDYLEGEEDGPTVQFESPIVDFGPDQVVTVVQPGDASRTEPPTPDDTAWPALAVDENLEAANAEEAAWLADALIIDDPLEAPMVQDALDALVTPQPQPAEDARPAPAGLRRANDDRPPESPSQGAERRGRTTTPPPQMPDPNEDLPSLTPDGVVYFRSFAQFLVQHEHQIRQGALLAEGSIDAAGDRHPLTAIIPDAGTVAIPNAHLMYRDGGRTGFAIDRDAFDSIFRNRMAQLGGRGLPNRTLAAAEDARAVPREDGPSLERPASRIDDGLNAEALLAIRDHEAPTAGNERSYVAMLNRVMCADRDAVCEVDRGEFGVRIWVRHGHIVAAERWPNADGDRIGERLIAADLLEDASLRRALFYSQATGMPLGQYLLSNYLVTRPQLHAVLRQQTLDRVSAPSQWSHGRLQAHPWSPPPVEAELIAVRREAVVTQLIHAHVSRMPIDEMKAVLHSHLNQSLHVDTSRIPTSSGLGHEDLQLIGRGAHSDRTMQSWLALAEASGPRGFTVVFSGLALGFLHLHESEPTIVLEPVPVADPDDDESGTLGRLRKSLSQLLRGWK